MSDDDRSHKRIIDAYNNVVGSYGNGVYYYVCEVCNKNPITHHPKTTLFKNPETTEKRGKENTKGKED